MWDTSSRIIREVVKGRFIVRSRNQAKRRSNGLRAIIATTVVGLSVGIPATASAATAPSPLIQAFSKWGDTNWYFALGGGTIETKTLNLKVTKWSAWYSYENEPWQVNGDDDDYSVALPLGATTLLKPTTVIYADDVRFFVKSPGGSGAKLTMTISVGSAATANYGATVSSVTYTLAVPTSGWGVTPAYSVPNALVDGSQTISIQVANTGSGFWKVDDFMMDPHRYT
jgi:hypothetical protein